MFICCVLWVLLSFLLVQLPCLFDPGIRVRESVVIRTLFFLYVGSELSLLCHRVSKTHCQLLEPLLHLCAQGIALLVRYLDELGVDLADRLENSRTGVQRVC